MQSHSAWGQQIPGKKQMFSYMIKVCVSANNEKLLEKKQILIKTRYIQCFVESTSSQQQEQYHFSWAAFNTLSTKAKLCQNYAMKQRVKSNHRVEGQLFWTVSLFQYIVSPTRGDSVWIWHHFCIWCVRWHFRWLVDIQVVLAAVVGLLVVRGSPVLSLRDRCVLKARWKTEGLSLKEKFNTFCTCCDWIVHSWLIWGKQHGHCSKMFLELFTTSVEM